MTSDHDPNQSMPSQGRGGFGSTERAIAGDVDFGIADTMSEAWALTSGSKGVILGGYLVAYLIYFVLGAAAYMVDPPTSEGMSLDGPAVASSLFQLAGTVLSYPIFAGIYMYSVKRAASDRAAGFGDITAYVPFLLPLIGLYLLQVILVGFGFLLLLLPGIYLSVAYTPALAVMLDKQTGVWAALETSRKGVSQVWFRFFGLLLVVSLVAVIGSFLTLGIGAIWLIPWATLCAGVAYRKIFGYGPDA